MPAVPFRRSASLLFCAVLTACGGSGGSSPTVPTPPPPAPVDPAPVPAITLLAGTVSGYGNADGPAAQARFAGPHDLVIDAAGNAYTLDGAGIRKLSAAGAVTTLVRAEGANAFLATASGLGIDGAGNLYVADTSNHVIRRVTPEGETSIVAGSLGEAGAADGARAAARLFLPNDVAVDAAGNLYVTDSGNARVRKVAPDGQVSTLAGSSAAVCTAEVSTYVCDLRDGAGAAARFSNPTAIAVDAAGNLAVTDAYALRRISPAGVVSTVPGRFNGNELQFGADGSLYVAGPSVVRVASNGGVATLADARALGTEIDGVGVASSYPAGIAIDGAGQVVIADVGTSTLRRIAPDGSVSHIAGQPPRLLYDDDAGGAMRFGALTALTVDASGNTYVVDEGRLRKITPLGKLSTLAQWQSAAIDGFGGNEPSAATADAAGNVFVADGNQILKISPTGAVTRHAGVTQLSAQVDGPAATARFGKLHAIAAGAEGRLYVADQETVRVVEADGSVRTLAGQADRDNLPSSGAVDGQGANARFAQPRGIAVDAAGNVYVADRGNGTIRKVTPSGLVSTLAGSAGQFGSADGSGPAARFQLLSGLSIDSAGALYASDLGNRTIRRITPAGAVTTLAGQPGADGLALGPLPGSLRGPRAVAWQGGALYVVDDRAVVKVTAPAR